MAGSPIGASAMNEEQPRKIRVTRNGPYMVTGGVPMHDETIGCNEDGDSTHWVRGKDYPPKGNYTLCRCGGSKNKPYCDGTHVHNGFDGTECASKEPYLKQARRRKTGPEVDLTDAEDLCAFARFCDRAGTIWKLVMQPGAEAKETTIQEGTDCPSGRLVVWTKEGEPYEPEFEQSIGVVDDPAAGCPGPLWVRGGIPVEAADGTIYEVRNRVTLCRCGKSSNMPFCDGSHAAETRGEKVQTPGTQ